MKIRRPAYAAACCLVLSVLIPAAAIEPDLALGYRQLPYTLPVPGSYALPYLGRAADGQVLDSDGRVLNLARLYGDKLVLLSFIYSTCSDVNGCPLATAVFHKIRRHLLKEPELARQLRLISLSFDPEHDTPAIMEHYGRSFGEGPEWRFLTTASERDIQSILAAYDQSAQKDYGADGQFTGTFSHILRVYLIDRDQYIRNIYTVSFLHPETLVNDLRTLLLEKPSAMSASLQPPGGKPLPGRDGRSRDERSGHAGRPPALGGRSGRPADLLEYAAHPPLGLPPLPVPADNPLTPAKIELGRKLFFDRRLSFNNTFSCALCHVPEQGYTHHEQATAVGIEGRSVRRNSPSLYNVGYFIRLFHDGREFSLEQQVWGPLLARNEMGSPSVGYVVEKIRGLADYAGLFETAFGRGPSMETVGMALASYQRTLNSADSAFDRWRFGRRKDALGRAAQRGYALFSGKAGCSSCHAIEEDHALFTDQDLHNTGVGYPAAPGTAPEAPKIQVAPGLSVALDPAVLAAVGEARPQDLGRYEITQDPVDLWKYKTPALRNVALTAPYMHDGSLATLKDVVRFYNRGGVPNEHLDPRIRPLKLTDREMDELVEFLEALTGSNVQSLISDAWAAPVGDPR